MLALDTLHNTSMDGGCWQIKFGVGCKGSELPDKHVQSHWVGSNWHFDRQF